MLQRPTPPEDRIGLTTIAGTLWFNSEAECIEYLAEPWWKKFLGLTNYHQHLKKRQKALR